MSDSFVNLKLSKHNLESYIVRSEIYKAVSNVMPLFSGKILDSGCGSMPYKNIILSNNDKVTNYIGLDIESGLNYENVNADFLWDGSIMPFEDSSFDVVISTEVMEHVPDPDSYLMEVKRVLKRDGKLYILEYDLPQNPLGAVSSRLINTFESKYYLDFINSDFYNYLNTFGFKIEKQSNYLFNHLRFITLTK